MLVGVLRSMRRLVGRGIVGLPVSASELSLLPRSGNMNDFGLDGSEDTMLLECIAGGIKNLTRGLVIIPNT